MNIKESLLLTLALFFLMCWLMVGAGVAWAVVRDNDQVSDMLVIGGIVGLIYIGITALGVMLADIHLNEYLKERRKDAS